MSTNHWHRLFNAWSGLSTPVRVPADVIEAIKAEVAGITGPILVLGLTAGLMNAGPDITAVDQSRGMVKDVWRGSAPGRRAVVADWLSLPFAAASFEACIGDGSLISFDYPARLQLVLSETARCLKPRGKFACRTFLAPDDAAGFAEIEIAVHQERMTCQIFKLRFAIAIAAELANPNVSVSSIPEFFDVRFPDRERLAAITGWDRAEIDTIDIYRKSPAIYAFPTKRQLLSAIPDSFENARLIPVANHPMGNEWPILVIEAR